MFLRRDHVLVKSVEVKFLGPGFQCVRVPVEFEGRLGGVCVCLFLCYSCGVPFSVLVGRSLWFPFFVFLRLRKFLWSGSAFFRGKRD